jgi:cytochrome c1
MLYTHAAAALLGAALAFGGAWKVQDWRYGKKEADRLAALVKAETKRDKASYEAATNFEKGRTRVETVFNTITETVEVIVDRPVYRNVCLDPDGLRALRDAAAETAASESGGTLPTAR